MTPEQRTLYDRIVEGPRGQRFSELLDDDGSLRGPFNPLLLQPAIGTAVQDLGASVRFAGVLADDVRELVILMVALLLPCEYEWEVHRSLGEAAGLDLDRVRNAASSNEPENDGDAHNAVMRACHSLIATAGLPDPEYARLEAMFGAAGVFELIAVFGYYSMLGRVINVFGVVE